jgi:peroxiredoxin
MRALVSVVVLAWLGHAAAADAETKHRSKVKVKPWLGISINDGDAVWGGVAVLDVFEDTPASLCGLRAGDEILAIDQIEVHGTSELQSTVGGLTVGTKIKVSYVRGGDVRRCKTKLAPQITDPTELLQRRLVDRVIPPFSLVRRSDGATIDDTTTRGHVVVLALFTTSCDACAATIGDLATRLAAEEDGANVELVAVAADGEQAVDAYVQRMGVTADLALDQGKLVSRYVSDRDAVVILVVDHEGVVRFAASGPGPDDTHLDTAAFCASRGEHARRKDD